MGKRKSDTSRDAIKRFANAVADLPAEAELIVQQKIPRQTAVKQVENLLFGYAKRLTYEMVEFALDREIDPRARGPLLAKAVEMIRPTKKGPLVDQSDRRSLTVVSRLGVPAHEVGPGDVGTLDVPPLREIEAPKTPEQVLTAGELAREGRAPATTKAMYGEITQIPSDLDVLESEPADETVPDYQPHLDPGRAIRKVTW